MRTSSASLSPRRRIVSAGGNLLTRLIVAFFTFSALDTSDGTDYAFNSYDGGYEREESHRDVRPIRAQRRVTVGRISDAHQSDSSVHRDRPRPKNP